MLYVALAALLAGAPQAPDAPSAPMSIASPATPAPPVATSPPALEPSAATPAPAAGSPVPAATAVPAPIAALGPAPPCPIELFRIARSTNANEIVYAAQLDPGGKLDEDDPLTVYWLMLAEDGHREGLNILEKMLAYGFSADPEPAGGYKVVLKAKKDRPVHLTLRQGCPVAQMEIAGRRAWLRRIFVQTSSGGVIPTVAHVDLVGLDPGTGREVKERILPD